MKRYKSIFKEQENTQKSEDIINDLINLDWSKDQNSKAKALQLFKGLIYANTENANTFIKDVSDFTTNLDKEKYNK